MEEPKSLSAFEVLNGVYDLFKSMGTELRFPSTVRTVVANDFDDANGYFGYDAVAIVEISGQFWAAARGSQAGGYPAEQYDCDFVAVKVTSDDLSDDELSSEIAGRLENCCYFHRSLIYAIYDGRFAFSRGGVFSKMVGDRIILEYPKFIVSKPTYRTDVIRTDLRRIVESSTQYRPEMVQFLYDAFWAILAESK